jgi:hypothetical protein
MGWPLAVAAGLMDKNPRALLAALWPLSAGHLLAMLVMLLPFAMLLALVQWKHQVQAFAALLVIAEDFNKPESPLDLIGHPSEAFQSRH